MIQLSLAEYDFLWEHWELGPFPTILDIASHGSTVAERDGLRRAAWTSLAAKGLGEPGGFDPRLERWLGRLARPEWELDARLHLRSGGPRTSALIGWTGADAVVAVLDAGRLGLWVESSARAVSAAVSLLPAHPPGTGTSITIPADTLDAAAARAGSDRTAFARALLSHGVGRDETNKLADVFGAVVRLGHFGFAHTPRGRAARERADHVVSFYDTHSHRYLFTRKASGDRHWVTLTPGTDAAVARQLDELRGTLVGV
ncbi:ESX secretion-associated protein EspG [Actinokineospora sp.]|uniref:ESX secretion-associated protein EspG n=1 Tax=Actinokineospora sp. TaxID=1872133 RepID=UPI0040382ECD